MKKIIRSTFYSSPVNHKNMDLNGAYELFESNSYVKLKERKYEEAFGVIIHNIFESIIVERELLSKEHEQIAIEWANILKKYQDGNKLDVAIQKIKKAITNLQKEGELQQQELYPFVHVLATKANLSDDIKKQLIGNQDTPKSLPGAIKKIQELAKETKTPEEAQQKAKVALEKAGLKGKLSSYENKIHKWIGKIPLVGNWYSKQSQTKQRIILGISIAVLAALVTMGVSWASEKLEAPTQDAPSSHGGSTELGKDVIKNNTINSFIDEHGGNGTTKGLSNGMIRVTASDGAEMLIKQDQHGGVDIINKEIDPAEFNNIINSTKNMSDIMKTN
jgi:predicted RNase H-like HicB family nuclease